MFGGKENKDDQSSYCPPSNMRNASNIPLGRSPKRSLNVASGQPAATLRRSLNINSNTGTSQYNFQSSLRNCSNSSQQASVAGAGTKSSVVSKNVVKPRTLLGQSSVVNSVVNKPVLVKSDIAKSCTSNTKIHNFRHNIPKLENKPQTKIITSVKTKEETNKLRLTNTSSTASNNIGKKEHAASGKLHLGFFILFNVC